MRASAMVVLTRRATAHRGLGARTPSTRLGGASTSLWFSDDRGATGAHVRRPSDERRDRRRRLPRRPARRLPVRADTNDRALRARELRTGDGGLIWTQVTLPAFSVIRRSRRAIRLHVFAPAMAAATTSGSRSTAGTTWTRVPLGARCVARARRRSRRARPAQRLALQRLWTIVRSARRAARAAAAPTREGLVGCARPTGHAVALPRRRRIRARCWATLHERLELQPAARADRDRTGPSATGPSARHGLARPAGGTTFDAYDPKRRARRWVRRGTGRWWRLAACPAATSTFAAPRSTPRTRWCATPSAVRLAAASSTSARPALDAPQVQRAGRRAHLRRAVELRRSADDPGYAWLRDGTSCAARLRRDLRAGRERCRSDSLGCRATARTGFGSSTVTSDPPAPRTRRADGTPAVGRATGARRSALPGRVTP